MKSSLKSYIIGFILSILLTLAAFGVVMRPDIFHVGYGLIIPIILILAIVQLFVQLIFFLHLMDESGPRWKLTVFISTVGLVLIIVVGGIWIMNHLNYNMMASPTEMNNYIQSQDGF
jgi:cytochrome o ubiquinol oxidase operon protein cyoD